MTLCTIFDTSMAIMDLLMVVLLDYLYAMGLIACNMFVYNP